MSSLGDDALMHHVAAGDVAKLGILFERHHRRVHAFFARLTGAPALAEDLTQEVFMRILRYRTTFRGDAPFSAWMYRLARNVASDHFARRRALTEPLAEAAEPVSSEPLASEALEHGERLARVRRSFRELAPEKRELLVLARFQGLPHAEIAEILGCSAGAVKVRVHRALRELRALADGRAAAEVGR
jgi:RNA polymerase sigma-70 factor (ECF subfamily)